MEPVSTGAAEAAIPHKRTSLLRVLWRLLKWTFMLILVLLATAATLVYAYEDDIKNLAIEELNSRLNAEVKIDPKNIDLTVISSFPDAAVDFRKAVVLEALNKKKRDTIIDAGKISLRFNLMDLIDGKYEIKKILLSDVKLDFLTDKNGKHNFIFLKESQSKKDVAAKGKELSFRLEEIRLNNIQFTYRNKKEFIKLKGTAEEAVLGGSFSDENYTLSTDAKLFFNELTLFKRSVLTNKNVSIQTTAEVSGKDWNLKETQIAINKVSLQAKGGVWKKDSIIGCDALLEGKHLDVSSAISLLPESQQEKVKDYQSEGNFYFTAKLKGELNEFEKLNANFDFGIEEATIKHIPSGSVLSNVNLKGTYRKAAGGKDELMLSGIRANMNSNVIKGDCKLTDLSDPLILVNADINAELAELSRFYPIDTIQAISGKVNMHAEVNGKLAELKNNYAEQKAYAKGEATLENLSLHFKNAPSPIRIKSGNLSIVQNDLSLKDIIVIQEENEITLNGELNNFFAWLLKEGQPLNITGNASANELKADKILSMFASAKPPTAVQTVSAPPAQKPISIPDKFLLDFKVNVGKAVWDKFTAENVSGKVSVKDGKITADELNFQAFDGDVTFNGVAAVQNNKIVFKGSSELVRVDVQKMFTQFNNFSQDAIRDNHIKGMATASIVFSTAWDADFNPDLSAIKVSSDILIEQGELNNYKPLEALSKFIEMTELKKIRFNTLKTHVDIKDQVVVLGKTEINNTAMNITLAGTHSFSNDIDYHISLLMSELMAKKPGRSKELDEELRLVENDPENRRTVFLRMTGNIDDIKIKFDRKAAKEKLKDDIKNEKKNLKVILKEEFGLFKKDTTLNVTDPNKKKKADQKFQIQVNDKKEDGKKKTEEDDEDF